MAELLDANDVMFTPYEPKLQNRFIVQIDGVPAYTIKSTNRPAIDFEEVELRHMNVKRFVKGVGEWQQLEMTLYDPIVPSAAQAVMEWVRLSHESVTGRDGYSDFYKKDITIQTLGPVGDIVEEWTLKGAFIQNATFGDLAFDSNDPVEITLTLRYDYAILQF
tara:strand:- start:182 stop:670 length:489 start_codon:yes stop_codon:yes gene_type:complete